MQMTDEKKRAFMKRLLLSRMRILVKNGFYGLLLMHMVYALDETIETAATDGKRIFFNPGFLDELNDKELDFIMMHEILHVVLKHVLRQGNRNPEMFNIATDIVVNSNILRSNNMDPDSITLRKYGESMHLAPDGKEGYEYTAEDVYGMLEGSGRKRDHGKNIAGSVVSPGSTRSGEANDSDSDETDGNVSNKSDCSDSSKADNKGASQDSRGGSGSSGSPAPAPVDDHTRWGTVENSKELDENWTKYFEDACDAIMIRDPSKSRGLLPAFAERILKDLREAQTDWRVVLNDFVQEDIVDYSFTPPDRRFQDSPFFLPDFNEKDEEVKDILFMVDTSASMSDDMITAAFSEIKGAIDQFNGKLEGWLGFFDATVIEPTPFEDIEEFNVIKPRGGGGTRFDIIFSYVNRFMAEKPPVSIIILTDGYAPFPEERATNGIPVLWCITNEDVTPPWGRIARI